MDFNIRNLIINDFFDRVNQIFSTNLRIYSDVIPRSLCPNEAPSNPV